MICPPSLAPPRSHSHWRRALTVRVCLAHTEPTAENALDMRQQMSAHPPGQPINLQLMTTQIPTRWLGPSVMQTMVTFNNNRCGLHNSQAPEPTSPSQPHSIHHPCRGSPTTIPIWKNSTWTYGSPEQTIEKKIDGSSVSQEQIDILRDENKDLRIEMVRLLSELKATN